jgi:hypothetical protein
LQWELDEKDRSFPDRTLNGVRSAVLLHDPIANGQAEASSAKLTASRFAR